jgi:hypothetical protein
LQSIVIRYFALRAEQGARRVAPRDHGLKHDANVRPRRLNKEPSAAENEDVANPSGDHAAVQEGPSGLRQNPTS